MPGATAHKWGLAKGTPLTARKGTTKARRIQIRNICIKLQTGPHLDGCLAAVIAWVLPVVGLPPPLERSAFLNLLRAGMYGTLLILAAESVLAIVLPGGVQT